MFESAIQADADRRRERSQPSAQRLERRTGCGPSVQLMLVSLVTQLIRGI